MRLHRANQWLTKIVDAILSDRTTHIDKEAKFLRGQIGRFLHRLDTIKQAVDDGNCPDGMDFRRHLDDIFQIHKAVREGLRDGDFDVSKSTSLSKAFPSTRVLFIFTIRHLDLLVDLARSQHQIELYLKAMSSESESKGGNVNIKKFVGAMGDQSSGSIAETNLGNMQGAGSELSSSLTDLRALLAKLEGEALEPVLMQELDIQVADLDEAKTPEAKKNRLSKIAKWIFDNHTKLGAGAEKLADWAKPFLQ